MNTEKLLSDAMHEHVDGVEPADGWPAIRRGIAGRRRRRWVTGTGLVAVAAVAAAVLVVPGLLDEGDTVESGPATPPEVEEGWRTIADAPAGLRGRQWTQTVWTGREAVVWGGATFTGAETVEPQVGGFAYDPAADSWRVVPDAPLAGRNGFSMVWTGEEVIVWGGSSLDDYQQADPTPFRDGAAYDPSTNTWRKIADNRFTAFGHVAVWTGSEMLVTAGQQPEDGPGMAGYDPETDTWAVRPEMPLPAVEDPVAVWTGSELVVWGGRYSGNTSGEASAAGASYSPADGTWRPMAEAPIEGRFEAAHAWTGSELLVFGGFNTDIGVHSAAAYDPAADAWTELPLNLGGRTPFGSAVFTGDVAVIWDDAVEGAGPDRGLTWDPSTGQWGLLPDFENAEKLGMTPLWTGEDLLILGGEANAAYRPESSEAECSAADFPPYPEPQEGLPASVAQRRDGIAHAAMACDFDSLAVLGGDDFTASFGGTDPVQLWREGEQRGEAPMRMLRKLLDQPYGIGEAQTRGAYYAWPRESVESDSYRGYRVGITATGEWVFFVGGD